MDCDDRSIGRDGDRGIDNTERQIEALEAYMEGQMEAFMQIYKERPRGKEREREKKKKKQRERERDTYIYIYIHVGRTT